MFKCIEFIELPSLNVLKELHFYLAGFNLIKTVRVTLVWCSKALYLLNSLVIICSGRTEVINNVF